MANLAGAQDAIKPIPPIPAKDKELSPADRAELDAGVAKLGQEIDTLRTQLKDKPSLLALLPDIQIYHNAVRYPLIYHELIDAKSARAALADAHAPLAHLRPRPPQWINLP